VRDEQFTVKYSNRDIEKLKNINIGVLAGGVSSERDISLKSGRAVAESLRGAGLRIAEIDIATDNLGAVKRILQKKGIELAFIALHGGFGEDGTIQRLLDEMGVIYTGSGPEASRLALDKIASRRLFEKSGLHTPKYKIIDNNRTSRDTLSLLGGDFPGPFVVKPAREGSSIGLSIVDSSRDFKKALSYAFKYGDKVIVEEYIEGREMTVAILADSALPPVEIKPKRRFFDFYAKYKKGLTCYVVPAGLSRPESSACREAALRAHRVLGCDSFSRVDIILSKGKPHVLEVNTIPGLTRMSLLPKAAHSAGLTFSDLCIKLLLLAYEKKR